MTVGFAVCGSHCTFSQMFPAMEELAKHHMVIPIFSQAAASDYYVTKQCGVGRQRTDFLLYYCWFGFLCGNAFRW